MSKQENKSAGEDHELHFFILEECFRNVGEGNTKGIHNLADFADSKSIIGPLCIFVTRDLNPTVVIVDDNNTCMYRIFPLINLNESNNTFYLLIYNII